MAQGRKGAEKWGMAGLRAHRLVRIRICGIIGFSGFSERSYIFGLAGFTVMAKNAIRAIVKS